MNVIFKKMGDIVNPDIYPVLAKEMVKFFDGITIREVTNFSNDCYGYKDVDRINWLIHKDWIMDVNMHEDLDGLFSMEL